MAEYSQLSTGGVDESVEVLRPEVARCHSCETEYLHVHARFCHICGSPRQEEDEEDAFARLFADVEERSYRAGTQVMVRGEPGTEMLLVAEGTLTVHLDDVDDEPLAELSQGQFCGEGAAVEESSLRTAHVVAKEDTTALVLLRRTVLQLESIWPGLQVALKQLFESRKAGHYDAREESDGPEEMLVSTLSRRVLDQRRENATKTGSGQGLDAILHARSMTTVTIAASRFKRILREKRYRKKMEEFKAKRTRWKQDRQDWVLYAITGLTVITCLVMGGCLGYVAFFRVDWWGRGCLEGEVRARETGVRDLDESSLCHVDESVLDRQMLLVLGSCLLEVIANVLYVVVVDVDLNEWFERTPAHRWAFGALAGAQAARAVGHALFFPECWLVVLSLLSACWLVRGDNLVLRTDVLVIMMIVWPWALALQIIGWLSHYLKDDWPLTGTEIRLVNHSSGCTAVSVDEYGYMNLYLKRLLALLCGIPLCIGSFRLLYTGFLDTKYQVSVSSSSPRSEAFKIVSRNIWYWMAYFWAVQGVLRIDGLVEWHPSESESRLFENTRYSREHGTTHPADAWLHHGGKEVLFDLLMAVFCFVPAILISLFKEKIWTKLNSFFERRQRLKDGAFMAAMMTSEEGTLTQDEMVKLGREKLRRVRWSTIASDRGILARKPGSSADDFDLSEPCDPGDIDFFISHAHKDNHEAKFRVLSGLAERFEEQHGRQPTFWLDTVCIDRRNPSEQLKFQLTSVFVMACDKFLILFSGKWCTRLWCIWELNTVFAMDGDVRRIQVLSLNKPHATAALTRTNSSPETGADWVTPEERLREFDVRDAKCWSKADERKIRSIIGANGRSGQRHFNAIIHRLSGQLSESLRVDRFGVPANKLKRVSRAGWLQKRFGLHQGLERHFFVAVDHHLYEFKDESQRQWLFAISLTEAEVMDEQEDSLRVEFQRNSLDNRNSLDTTAETPGEWHMRCSSQSERDEWVEALQQEIDSSRPARTKSNSSLVASPRGAPAEEPGETLSLGNGKKYHAFLSHDWGRDGSGRNNHARVSIINDMLKKKGIVTWCAEQDFLSPRALPASFTRLVFVQV